MVKSLNVAVVGLGVGEQHILAYDCLPHTQVTIICDISLEKLHEVGLKYPQARQVMSYDEIIADPSVEIISIASYDEVHAKQVISALLAGKHVFVEKPMCQTFDEASRIKSIWQKESGRLKLMSNLVLRAAPLYLWLKEQISSGSLGQIYAFDGDYLYGRLSKITEGWRKDVTDYSVMEGGGIHLIDLFLWLVGEKPKTVCTSGNNISTKESGFRYDDFMAATMETSSGLVARISANYGCVHRHQHVIRIFGTKGTFIYDDMGPRIHTTRDPGIQASTVYYKPKPETKGALITAFVDAIINDKDISNQTQMIFDVMAICIASDQSLKTQLPVQVEYI